MADSDMDEDLKKASAESMANVNDSEQTVSYGTDSACQMIPISKAPAVVVDLSRDSDGSEDEKAIHPQTMSVAGAKTQNDNRPVFHEKVQKPSISTTVSKKPEVASEDIPPKSLLQGLDRKQMEAERLQRQKRKASISPPGIRRSKQRTETYQRPSVNQESSAPRSDCLEKSASGPVSTQSSHPENLKPSPSPGIQFPRGTVRKTWAFGCPRDEDIKIEEVLQKSDLKIAVLSAFQWDVEWLFRKVDLAKTKIVFVMQAKDEATVGLSD